RWADAYAVAAEHAGCVWDVLVEERGDVAAHSAAAPGQSERVLHVLSANLDAAPAHDALSVVADVERVVVEYLKLASSAAGEGPSIRAVALHMALNLRRVVQING